MGTKKNYAEQVRKEMEQANYEILYYNVSDLVKMSAAAVGKSLSAYEDRKVISSISSRLKSPSSICRKLEKKGLPQTFESARVSCADLIGVRIVTMYVDDIYRIAGALKKCPGIKLLYEKDFIKRPKKSGYRSLHLIVAVEAFHNSKHIVEKCEVQIRTMEMDSWAELEHQLIYKNNSKDRAIENELKQWAYELAEQDRKLIALRKRIMTPAPQKSVKRKRKRKKSK